MELNECIQEGEGTCQTHDGGEFEDVTLYDKTSNVVNKENETSNSIYSFRHFDKTSLYDKTPHIVGG